MEGLWCSPKGKPPKSVLAQGSTGVEMVFVGKLSDPLTWCSPPPDIRSFEGGALIRRSEPSFSVGLGSVERGVGISGEGCLGERT